MPLNTEELPNDFQQQNATSEAQSGEPTEIRDTMAELKGTAAEQQKAFKAFDELGEDEVPIFVESNVRLTIPDDVLTAYATDMNKQKMLIVEVQDRIMQQYFGRFSVSSPAELMQKREFSLIEFAHAVEQATSIELSQHEFPGITAMDALTAQIKSAIDDKALGEE
jgi:hypothetical protein